jgi:hypothetical protein
VKMSDMIPVGGVLPAAFALREGCGWGRSLPLCRLGFCLL